MTAKRYSALKLCSSIKRFTILGIPTAYANVREINSLRLANRNSEYLKMIYGKSLYNQIVSYVQLKARHKNPEFRQACTERIDKFCSELTALHKQNPDNGTIFRSLMMANMMLCYPGAKD